MIVLVVDDNTSGRQLLVDIMQSINLQVIEAANGFEALDKARAHHPDLIILDVSMPGMPGFEVVEQHYLVNGAQGPWVLGEQYTVADGYLFTIAGWLASDGVDIARFPKVAAHFERVAARPAVQRALA